jgi:hypothetical protein
MFLQGAHLLNLLVQGLYHLRVRMAHNGWAPAAHIVNVLRSQTHKISY